ncbi:MAG: V-type ATP synthase subunit E [Sulfolobaceae archaeon]|nr:V-type ATP synthase subunit E [Sulfolobaceae archaeon]
MELRDLIDIASDKVKKEIEENLKNALNEAQKTFEDGYNSLVREHSRKVEDFTKREKDLIDSERAKIDVENKRIIMLEREKWIDKVIEEVNKRLSNFFSEDDYKEVLENILKKYLPQEGEVIVVCNPRDTKVIKTLAKDLNVKVKVQEDNKIIGGIKIINEKDNSAKDLSLNLILSQLFEEVKPKIFEILFGGE